MYSSKLSSIFLSILLHFSSTDAKLDPSTYTVTLDFSDGTSCFGGILGENILISAAQCFGTRSGEAYNFTSVKAVVGSIEVPVSYVSLPNIPSSKGKVLRDYALVWLKQKLNLTQNGLIALTLPTRKINSKSWGLVGWKPKNYTLVDFNNCPNLSPNSTDLNFVAESHLCVELPNSDNRCLDQLGAPMVVPKSGKNAKIYIIGIYLACYVHTAHEIFARIYFALDMPSGRNSMHHYP